MTPLVAVVGRPNVGKSTLFNKIAGQRLSIVEDTPGVTRDRIFYETDWNGKQFTLVDTGGIEPHSDDIILAQMRRQAQLAIESADVVVMVVDIKTGVTATDSEVAQMLLKAHKKIILCVNKVDRPGEHPPELDVYKRQQCSLPVKGRWQPLFLLQDTGGLHYETGKR